MRRRNRGLGALMVMAPLGVLLAGVIIPTRPVSAGSPTTVSLLPTPTPASASEPTPVFTPTSTLTPITPTPSPSQAPPPTPAPTPPPAQPSASAAPHPSPAAVVPSTITGAIVVADPLLAAPVSQASQVLQQPVALERPGLLHFAVAASYGSSASGHRPGGTASRHDGASGLAASQRIQIALALSIAALLALLTLGISLWMRGALPRMARLRRWRPSPVQARRAALALVIAVSLVVPGGGAAVELAGQTPADGHTLDALAAVGGVRPDAMAAHQLASNADWRALVGIEDQLSRRQTAIVVNEHQIAAVSARVDQVTSGPEKREGASEPVLADQLTSLVTQHAALQSAYQLDLQTEYDFFAAAAQSPERLAAVVAAATVSSAQARRAVDYDVEVVQTQQAQEAAINAATAAAAAAAAATPALPRPRRGALTFHAPLSGVVTQGFGPSALSLEPPLTFGGVFYPHFHTGLDIAAPQGALVGAAADGVVLLATSSVDSSGNLVGYGNYVLIEHRNGLLSVYGHLSRILVHDGQKVRQGQVIGLCGSSGWSTGPHVHFEIRLNGIPVDPAPYIRSNLRR